LFLGSVCSLFAKDGCRKPTAEPPFEGTEALTTPGTVLARSMALAEELRAVISIITQAPRSKFHCSTFATRTGIALLGVCMCAKKQAGTAERHSANANFRNYQPISASDMGQPRAPPRRRFSILH